LAATVEERRKQRRARVDWAGLLRRTFALLRLSGVWRQAQQAIEVVYTAREVRVGPHE